MLPHPPTPAQPAPASADFGKVKAEARDVVWDRPVFRAPHLPSPRIAFELAPQPFTHRLTAGR